MAKGKGGVRQLIKVASEMKAKSTSKTIDPTKVHDRIVSKDEGSLARQLLNSIKKGRDNG